MKKLLRAFLIAPLFGFGQNTVLFEISKRGWSLPRTKMNKYGNKMRDMLVKPSLKADTTLITIDGKQYDLITKTNYTTSSASVEIETEENTYWISLVGDLEAISAEEMKQFFRSFKVRD